MKDTQIEKALDLLNNNKLEDLKLYLQGLYFKSQDNPNVKLFETVKTYLKNAEKTRPVLQTIQHKDNIQFICDGYTLFEFTKHIPELDELSNTLEESLCLNYKQLFRSNIKYINLEENELLLLKNISKYIKWFKSLDYYNNINKEIWISFRERIFNAKFIETIVKIMGLDDLQFELGNNVNYQTLQFKNKSINGLIIPIRYDPETFIKINDITNNFINKLKENN